MLFPFDSLSVLRESVVPIAVSRRFVAVPYCLFKSINLLSLTVVADCEFGNLQDSNRTSDDGPLPPFLMHRSVENGLCFAASFFLPALHGQSPFHFFFLLRLVGLSPRFIGRHGSWTAGKVVEHVGSHIVGDGFHRNLHSEGGLSQAPGMSEQIEIGRIVRTIGEYGENFFIGDLGT